MGARQCDGRAHQEARANYEEAIQHRDYERAKLLANVAVVNVFVPVETDDVIEAAVAYGCSCQDQHCPALLDYLPPQQWLPEHDSQADGEGKE